MNTGAGRLDRAAPWVVIAAVIACYGPRVGRHFTSEDFLLVRFLGEHPPWRDLVSLFSAPWLEISVVAFWRPVSTLLYGAEVAVFGGNPLGYNVVHVLVHTGNALLVWAIARRLVTGGDRDAASPLAAALLFAVHPLHPNAVIFSASFATLFGATFVFGALLAYLRFRESGSRSQQAWSLALFALGLGAYEAAAVFPALIAAVDHLQAGSGSMVRRHLRRVPGYLPFVVLLGAYFLVRKSVFGVFVGGYPEQSQSLTAPQAGVLLRDLWTSIVQIHVPLFEGTPGAATQAIVGVLVLGLPLILAWLLRGTGQGFLRRWCMAWVWTIAAMAPFVFKPSVPGNGRYWYFAAAGVAMSLALVARAASLAMRSHGRLLVSSALALFGAFWTVLLVHALGTYTDAGETTRRIQRDLLRMAGTAPVSFLAHYPYFLTTPHGVPVAQVYHYGVWDSVHPPFVPAGVPVYPLPQLQGAELLPVFRGAPDSRVLAWDPQLSQVREVAPPGDGPQPVELEVVGPAVAVNVPPGLAARFRLVVVARGNGTVVDLEPESAAGSLLTAALPAEFCRTMVRLYGDHDMFWWIEARGASGELTGFTALRRFRFSE